MMAEEVHRKNGIRKLSTCSQPFPCGAGNPDTTVLVEEERCCAERVAKFFAPQNKGSDHLKGMGRTPPGKFFAFTGGLVSARYPVAPFLRRPVSLRSRLACFRPVYGIIPPKPFDS